MPNVAMRRRRGPYKVRTHGHRRDHGTSLTYQSWTNMRKRCASSRRPDYADVFVCERWDDFNSFLADMGERPSLRHSIDRIDPAGNYEPDNCRWATTHEQARNKRSTVMLTHPDTGESMCSADWAKRLGVRKSTIHYRLKHWPLRRVLAPGDHRRARTRLAAEVLRLDAAAVGDKEQTA